MSTQTLRWMMMTLLGVGLLAAGWGVYQRIHVEGQAHAVELVVEYQQVAGLAGAAGVPSTEDSDSITETLKQLRDAGVTTVAIPEETLTSLEDQGMLAVTGSSGWRFFDNNRILMGIMRLLDDHLFAQPLFVVDQEGTHHIGGYFLGPAGWDGQGYQGL